MNLTKGIKLLIIGLFALTTIFIISQTVGASFTYTASSNNSLITEDGYVNPGGTKYYQSPDVDYQRLVMSYNSGKMGYVEFDLSGMPTGDIIINSVALRQYTTMSTVAGATYIYNLTVQPSASTGDQILAGQGEILKIKNNGFYPDNCNSVVGGPSDAHDWGQTVKPWDIIEQKRKNGVDWVAFYISVSDHEERWESDEGSTYNGTCPLMLVIEYQFFGPYMYDPTPANESVEVETPVRTYINFVDGAGEHANLTWQWYDTDHWYNYSTNATYLINPPPASPNGTYSAPFTNASAGGVTYYWRVFARDNNDNISYSGVYSFTTIGALPPTNIDCDNHNSTAINISFTESAGAIGSTVHTVCRYAAGYVPPTWTSGTLAFNTTDEYYIVSGLSEGTCYSFSLWTNIEDADGNWNLSESRGFVSPCCTGGGDYRICFRWENSSYNDVTLSEENNYINFSCYPCSTHLLTIHHLDAPDKYYYINATWYVNNNNCSCINVSTNDTVLFFEFTWNWSVDLDCSECALDAVYSRKLTPNSAGTATFGEETIDLITFYMLANCNVYNDWYYYNESGNCTGSVITELSGNIVNYDFSFDDSTNIYAHRGGIDTYSTFYCYNNTQKIIIHEEYWDSEKHVHPPLLYAKKYFNGVACSADSIELVGITPTAEWVYPYGARVIKIDHISDEIADKSSIYIDYGWTTGGGLWTYFLDTNYDTTEVNCHIDNYDGTEVYNNTKYSSEFNFTYPAASNTLYYHIYIDFIQTINATSFNMSYDFWIMPGESRASIADTINTTLSGLFGRLPSRTSPTGETVWMTWAGVIIGMVAIASFSFGCIISIGAGTIFSGISSIFMSIYIYGVSINTTTFLYAGAFLIFIGVLLYMIGRD